MKSNVLTFPSKSKVNIHKYLIQRKVWFYPPKSLTQSPLEELMSAVIIVNSAMHTQEHS